VPSYEPSFVFGIGTLVGAFVGCVVFGIVVAFVGEFVFGIMVFSSVRS